MCGALFNEVGAKIAWAINSLYTLTEPDMIRGNFNITPMHAYISFQGNPKPLGTIVCNLCF